MSDPSHTYPNGKNGRHTIYPPTGAPVLGSIPWAGRPHGSHELYVKGESTKKLTW